MGLAFCSRVEYHWRLDKSDIERLASTLAEAVPEGLSTMRGELENNFRTVLRDGLAKLDLVTREEFEVQEAVLRRTREKLDRLEQQMKALESADT
jgi:BMFP domain-containing protein YqiC